MIIMPFTVTGQRAVGAARKNCPPIRCIWIYLYIKLRVCVAIVRENLRLYRRSRVAGPEYCLARVRPKRSWYRTRMCVWWMWLNTT